jgi:hypothetical protein
LPDSILDNIKKVLGLDPSYTVYDIDIVMHINSVFSDLEQIGIGPTGGFSIEDNTALWSAFLGDDPRLNSAKSYMYLRVRLLFDPPTITSLLESMNKQIEKIEWRLNVLREGDSWTDPGSSEMSSTTC